MTVSHPISVLFISMSYVAHRFIWTHIWVKNEILRTSEQQEHLQDQRRERKMEYNNVLSHHNPDRSNWSQPLSQCVCVCTHTHVCAHNFFLKVCEKQTSPDPDFTQLCSKSFSLFNRQKKSIIYGCIYRDVIYKAKVIFNKFRINGFHN